MVIFMESLDFHNYTAAMTDLMIYKEIDDLLCKHDRGGGGVQGVRVDDHTAFRPTPPSGQDLNSRVS